MPTYSLICKLCRQWGRRRWETNAGNADSCSNQDMFGPSSLGGSARPAAAATSSGMTIPGMWQVPRIYLMSATAGKSPLSYHDVTDFLSRDTIEEEVVTGTLSRRRLLQGHYQGGGCYRDTIEEEVVTGTLSRRRLLQGHYRGGGCYRDTIEEELEAYNLEKERHNPPEVAKHLEEMFVTFPQELRLWNEVTELVETLQSESVVEQTVFLQGSSLALLDELPSGVLQ
ncbi:hypothetical protein LSAT2_022895 [Lamellibrachia satsuma]|nr:hypothetical protein LSAT2_022895 [Lamellibrachia satsuma]